MQLPVGCAFAKHASRSVRASRAPRPAAAGRWSTLIPVRPFSAKSLTKAVHVVLDEGSARTVARARMDRLGMIWRARLSACLLLSSVSASVSRSKKPNRKPSIASRYSAGSSDVVRF